MQAGGSASPPVRLKIAGPAATPPASTASGVLQLVPEHGALECQPGSAGRGVPDSTPAGQLLDNGPSTMAEAGSCASSEVRIRAAQAACANSRLH